jgi:hypothetical protein
MRTPARKLSAASRRSALPINAPPGAISGKVGDVFFDDANTFQGTRCLANNTTGTVIVEIEIYPDSNDYAFVAIHCGRYRDLSDRKHLELKADELEPFAVALTRAVANARQRGFLPADSK